MADGYTAEVGERHMVIDAITEEQFRQIEQVIGRPRFWLGRYKTGRDILITEDTCAVPTGQHLDALIAWLRAQRLAYTESVETRYEPEA